MSSLDEYLPVVILRASHYSYVPSYSTRFYHGFASWVLHEISQITLIHRIILPTRYFKISCSVARCTTMRYSFTRTKRERESASPSEKEDTIRTRVELCCTASTRLSFQVRIVRYNETCMIMACITSCRIMVVLSNTFILNY